MTKRLAIAILALVAALAACERIVELAPQSVIDQPDAPSYQPDADIDAPPPDAPDVDAPDIDAPDIDAA